MAGKQRFNLVPIGIVAAVLLSFAVAWAYLDQESRTGKCAELYAAAATAADSARVDSVVFPSVWTGAPVPCGELEMRAR